MLGETFWEPIGYGIPRNVKTDWERSLFEVGKADKLVFTVEMWVIQLPFRVSICFFSTRCAEIISSSTSFVCRTNYLSVSINPTATETAKNPATHKSMNEMSETVNVRQAKSLIFKCGKTWYTKCTLHREFCTEECYWRLTELYPGAGESKQGLASGSSFTMADDWLTQRIMAWWRVTHCTYCTDSVFTQK